ncbi:MAG: hypothetical protein IIV78_01650, partial [Oscillospiraceae bacterium]|nr:hypothetical protein [Oscillospiraceae bacterium]
FTGGIKVRSTDLAECLGYNYSYWTSAYEIATLTDGQTELSGDVTVKKTPALSLTYGTTTLFFDELDNAATQFGLYGGTLKLLKNLDLRLADGESVITLTGMGTFDLNGHTIKTNGGAAAIKVTSSQGNITITDSSEAGTGKIFGSAGYSVWHGGQYNVTIDSGTYLNVGRMHTGSLLITGGTFTSSYPLYDNCSAAEGSLKLYGGTFEQGLKIQGPTPMTTNVGSILGLSTLTYQVGDEIWDRARVDALGNVQEFESGKRVEVVKQSDAVASYTDVHRNNADATVYYYTTLTAAFEKAFDVDDYFNYVTVLKDTDEDITMRDSVSMIFKANASGVFTFPEFNYGIFLRESLPDDMVLHAKLENYPTDENDRDYVLYVDTNFSIPGTTVAVDDVAAVDEGIEVTGYSLAIGLHHEHQWEYKLTDTGSKQTISMTCGCLPTCDQPAGTKFATISLSDTTVTYTGTRQHCVLETGGLDPYAANLPNEGYIKYYDADGDLQRGGVYAVGTYTAKLTFGGITAEAEFTIEKDVPTADDFVFEAPEGLVYDGEAKLPTVTADPAVTGMGEITLTLCDAEGNPINETPRNAGTYTVKVSVAESDYFEGAQDITSSEWTYTVLPRTLIAYAEDLTKTFGEEDPDLTAIIDGLVAGETATVALIREEGENAGTYAIKLDEEASVIDANYTLDFTEGIFTIEPKAVTADVILSQSEFTYDGTAHEPTVTAMDGETVIPESEFTVVYANNTLVSGEGAPATVTLLDNEGGNYIVSGGAEFTVLLAQSIDNVTPEDKEDLEDIRDSYPNPEEMPEGPEKDSVTDTLEKIDEMLESIERIERAEDLLDALPETAEPDDEDALDAYFEAKDAYDALTDYEKSLIDEALKEKLENLAAALVAYKILEGDDQTWKKGSGDDLTISANGLFSKFAELQIDGETVDSENYTAESGSTVVTLKASFLETLKVGKHTVTFVYPDGKAEGTLTIEAAPVTDNGSEKPDTGDHSALLVWFAVMAAAACGAVLTLRKKREQ